MSYVTQAIARFFKPDDELGWPGLEWFTEQTAEELVAYLENYDIILIPPTSGKEKPLDAPEQRKHDPTHGMIDKDIQEKVAEMYPSSLSQRVAIENTLQERREKRARALEEGREWYEF